MSKKDYTVRAAQCDHKADYNYIYETLKQITAPLTKSWKRIEKA